MSCFWVVLGCIILETSVGESRYGLHRGPALTTIANHLWEREKIVAISVLQAHSFPSCSWSCQCPRGYGSCVKRYMHTYSLLGQATFPDPAQYGPPRNLTHVDGSSMTPMSLASDAEYWKQAAKPRFVPPHHVRGEGHEAEALRARPTRTGIIPD